jgi:GT2 family glycosyltransferase
MPERGLVCAAIVPTLGRPDLVRACLDSLAACDPRFAQVVVADQDDTDRLRAEAGRHGFDYLHLERRGLSRARNAALARVRPDCDWVYFPDDDCTVPPDVLAALARALAPHPRVAFASARVVSPAGRALMPAAGAATRVLAAPDPVLRTVMSPGLFVRRDLLERLGGFDEAFGVGARWPSGEESDLLFRALALGERGLYAPEVHVTHPEPFEVRDHAGGRERAWRYGVGWGAMFAKHSARPGGAGYLALHAWYLARALAGVGLSLLRFAPEGARRYAAILAGRWTGFLAYRSDPGR